MEDDLHSSASGISEYYTDCEDDDFEDFEDEPVNPMQVLKLMMPLLSRAFGRLAMLRILKFALECAILE